VAAIGPCGGALLVVLSDSTHFTCVRVFFQSGLQAPLVVTKSDASHPGAVATLLTRRIPPHTHASSLLTPRRLFRERSCSAGRRAPCPRHICCNPTSALFRPSTPSNCTLATFQPGYSKNSFAQRCPRSSPTSSSDSQTPLPPECSRYSPPDPFPNWKPSPSRDRISTAILLETLNLTTLQLPMFQLQISHTASPGIRGDRYQSTQTSAMADRVILFLFETSMEM